MTEATYFASATEMVSACRTRYPGADVRRADARDLAGFADREFDLVIFSFNGIDYMPPEDHPRALGAVFRVLRPGRAFVFSTHNLNAVDPDAMGRFGNEHSRCDRRVARSAGDRATIEPPLIVVGSVTTTSIVASNNGGCATIQSFA